MQLRYLCLIPMLGLYFQSIGQKNGLSGIWTDGQELFTCKKVNDTLLLFEGYSLHEGAVPFFISIDRNNALTIANPHTADTNLSETSYMGNVGDRVVHKVINGTGGLIIESREGVIHNFLQAIPPGESLHELYIRNKVNGELSGKYINKANNKEVIFYPNKTIVEGLADSKNYKFEENYDVPGEVITFGKGKTFCYERSGDGLDIFKAKPVDDEFWEKGAKLMSLQRVSSLDSAGQPEINGKFAFASRQFMIRGILRYFSASDRRLIRNEIFARHGYIFKAEDLKKYFGAQPWYKPQFNDVNDQLTDMEKLNIRLIGDYKGDN